MICRGCGLSVRGLRFYVIPADSQLLPIISHDNYQDVATIYACRACWTRANRQIIQDSSKGLQENVEPAMPHESSTPLSPPPPPLPQPAVPPPQPPVPLPQAGHAASGDHSHHRNYSKKEDIEEIAENPVVAESCADAGDTDPIEELRVDYTDIFDDNDDDDDSDTLVESNVCRVCLALDVKMYDLKDIELREMFQNITGIIVTENNHSILERLCWECAGRLRAAAAFRNKALLSDALLQGLANTGEQIRKYDITLIKEKKDYLKPARTLSTIDVFHTVEIDPENESLPFISENSDTEVQNTRKDSIDLQESVIEENNDEMEVEDEMIETPIKTEIEYDNICPNTGEENINIVLETDPLFSNKIRLTEDTINSAYSSPQPSCSHVEPKNPILACLRKTPSGCEFNKIKKSIITNRDSISKIVFKKPKDQNTLKGVAKLKNINVKVSGISKKTSSPD